MALQLPDSWVWDSWCVDDGERYHLFFLFASRALRDPARRHLRASIGHAVSADLRDWQRLPDVLVRSDAPAFDDVAVWTGSVVADPAGDWRLFYTGVTGSADTGFIQRIGMATSPDLMTWTRSGKEPVLEADSRWYERLADGVDEEAFRDPFVFADPAGDGWHMLITARSSHGPRDDRGVIGHAWSPDLVHWELGEPLTSAGQGFAHLEVMQVRMVRGEPLLIFSCLQSERAAWAPPVDAGLWTARAGSLLGPFDLRHAQPLTSSQLYAGPAVVDRTTGEWVYLAFEHDERSSRFGRIVDPMPLP